MRRKPQPPATIEPDREAEQLVKDLRATLACVPCALNNQHGVEWCPARGIACPFVKKSA